MFKDFFTQVVFGGGGSWCGGHIWGSRYNSDPKDEWQNEQDQIKSDPEPPKTSRQYISGSAHGNSLDCAKPTQGYALIDVDTGDILKYGETTRGVLRYTKSYYTDKNARMYFMSEGSKREMHYWQHEMILSYTAKYGKRPPLNKSDW